MDWSKSLQKTARGEAWKLVSAARQLKASGERCTGEAFLALMAETAFKMGAAYSLRRMAGDVTAGNILRPLFKNGFASYLPEWEEETEE